MTITQRSGCNQPFVCFSNLFCSFLFNSMPIFMDYIVIKRIKQKNHPEVFRIRDVES